jgi:hypothetical protein
MTKFENFHWKRIIVTFALSEEDLGFIKTLHWCHDDNPELPKSGQNMKRENEPF